MYNKFYENKMSRIVKNVLMYTFKEVRLLIYFCFLLKFHKFESIL